MSTLHEAAVEMVEKQLRRRGIRDQRVLNAMLIIAREEFVATQDRDNAYADAPLPIGYGQTITQPYMVRTIGWVRLRRW